MKDNNYTVRDASTLLCYYMAINICVDIVKPVARPHVPSFLNLLLSGKCVCPLPQAMKAIHVK